MRTDLKKITRGMCFPVVIWAFLFVFTGCEYIKQQNEEYNKRMGQEEKVLP